MPGSVLKLPVMPTSWRADALRSHKQVIVIEEHAPQGGLAPQTKQIAWDIRASCRLDTFTLQDAFIHNYGSHDDLLAAHGLEPDRILRTIGADV